MKVLFVCKLTEQTVIKEMTQVPARGDRVPIFVRNSTVETVCWFPGSIEQELKGIDVMVYLT